MLFRQAGSFLSLAAYLACGKVGFGGFGLRGLLDIVGDRQFVIVGFSLAIVGCVVGGLACNQFESVGGQDAQNAKPLTKESSARLRYQDETRCITGS